MGGGSHNIRIIFEEIENRLNWPLTAKSLSKNNGCYETLRELLDLKINWPFRRKSSSGLANYFFEDQLYSRSPVNYESIGKTVSRYNNLLKELESQFNSAKDLQAAEDLIDELINKVINQVDRLKVED